MQNLAKNTKFPLFSLFISVYLSFALFFKIRLKQHIDSIFSNFSNNFKRFIHPTSLMVFFLCFLTKTRVLMEIFHCISCL